MSGIIREAKPGTSQSEKQKQPGLKTSQSRLGTSQSGKGGKQVLPPKANLFVVMDPDSRHSVTFSSPRQQQVLPPRSASAEPRPVSTRAGSARSFKIPIHKAVPDVFDVESQPELQSGRR